MENYPKLRSTLSLGWERDNKLYWVVPFPFATNPMGNLQFTHSNVNSLNPGKGGHSIHTNSSNQMITECGNIVCQARPPSPAGCHSRDMRPESQFPTKTATFPLCAILYYYVLDAAETLAKMSKLLLWYFSINDLNAK